VDAFRTLVACPPQAITAVFQQIQLGYDPLFYYAPFGRTFGETEPDAKMGVSHRGLALQAMLEALQGGG
jgi:inosine/xanthosine triphosphate pyrophosphatase family protein